MNLIEIALLLGKGFIFFLIAMGALAFFYPVRITIHPPQGLLLGVAFTSSFQDSEEQELLEDINYLFFSVHLLVGSIGIFVDLGLKDKE